MSKSIKRGKCFSDNFSKKLSKMISADINTDVKQEMKELVAASYNFSQKYFLKA